MISTANKYALKLEDVCSHVGTFELKNISFELGGGNVLSVLGPSGSGKTVLLRTIVGLIKLDSGKILLGSHRIDDYSPKDRKVGFVFQNYALFPHLDSKLNLGFPLYIRGKKKKEVYVEATNVAQELDGLPNYLEFKPSELPEGMKQLIALGREKLNECNLLLLDEPLSQLDRKLHVEMRTLLKKFITDLSKTTVAVFSDPEDAIALSNYIMILDNGEILQYGETFEVYNNPINIKVMELLSRLGLNIIDLEIVGGKIFKTFSVNLPDGLYKLCFRPEEIEVSNKGLEVISQKSYIYDSSRKIIECDFKGQVLKLLVPKSTSQKFKFVPTNPKFFNL